MIGFRFQSTGKRVAIEQNPKDLIDTVRTTDCIVSVNTICLYEYDDTG